MMDSPNMPQPKPHPGRGAVIPDLVVADIRERDAAGTKKYGQRLQAHDGRNHLIDAYQEAIDLVMYLRQEIEERATSEKSSEVQPPAEPSGNPGELPVCATRFIGFPACCVLSNEERIFDHAFHGQYDLSGACLTCGKPEGHHQWTTSKPEPGGTFACPICGVTSVHQHTGSEIAEFMVRATCNGNRVVNMDGSAGDAGVSPQSTPTKPCPDCSAAQPATEQPRIWRMRDSQGVLHLRVFSSERTARRWANVAGGAVVYSIDNGKTWIDEQEEREGK